MRYCSGAMAVKKCIKAVDRGDAAQCGPRHLWRLSTWVSSQASTAALRYLR